MEERIKYVVVAVGLLVLGVFPARAMGAGYYFSPSSGNYSSGQNFSVQVYINTGGVTINAAEGTISFPTRYLKVQSISTTDSVFKFWSQDPTFSNSSGNIDFGGGLPSPGVSSPSAKVLTINFQALGAGDASLKIENGAILANDGSGTNILTDSQPASYHVNLSTLPPPDQNNNTPPPVDNTSGLPSKPFVSSPTHPDENTWYNANNFDASWDVPAGVTGVSYVLVNSANYSAAPSDKGLVSGTSYDLTKFTDGIWYFYTQFKNQNGWGERVQRKVKIDRTPPTSVLISRTDTTDPTNPQPAFSFSSTDSVSGIAKYEIQIGDGDWIDVSTLSVSNNSYILPLQTPGTRALKVKAVDYAGNYAESDTSFEVKSITPPKITFYPQTLDAYQSSFEVRGESDPNQTINLKFRKGDSTFEFSTKSGSDGTWSAQYTSKIPSGNWELRAEAVDYRGAVSDPSDPANIDVQGIFSRFAPYLAEGGVLGALAIIVIGILLALAYFIFHHLMLWKLFLKKDLRKIKERVHEDLSDLEKELGSAKTKNAKAIRQKIEKIDKDVQKEIDQA